MTKVTDFEPGQTWVRHGDIKGKPHRIEILAVFTDLNGRRRLVFHEVTEPRFVDGTKIKLHQTKWPPKMVTPCYLACCYDLEKEG